MHFSSDRYRAQMGVRDPSGEASDAVGNAALGTVAKSSTPPGNNPGAFDLRLVRAERFALTAEARRLLLNKGRAEGLKYHHKVHRTAGCHYIPHGKIFIHQSCEHKRAFFTGVQVCGSVWGCPICAAKVSERRRLEIQETINWAYASKLQPMMITLTFPHQRSDDLGDLLDKQRAALEILREGGAWTNIKKRWGFQGLIRALEITHSERNGWHPHTHELWFVNPNVTAGDVKTTVLKRWKEACVEVGLLDPEDGPSWRAFDVRAVDVKPWISASDYLAKMDSAAHWGADREMAKASSKGTRPGRRSGTHPFGLLRRSLDGGKGSQRAGQLFVDYLVTVTKKRCRALFFSPGLKAKVGIEDKNDKEVAQEQREEADILGRLEAEDWRLIRSLNSQSRVLDAAEQDGWEGVILLLGELSKEAGREAPKSKRRPLAEVRAEAEEAATLRQQERQAQVAAQSADRYLDAALTRVREQSSAVHVAMLAEAEIGLKKFVVAGGAPSGTDSEKTQRAIREIRPCDGSSSWPTLGNRGQRGQAGDGITGRRSRKNSRIFE